MEDLHVICGEKTEYTLEDAATLYKKQWKVIDYRNAMDVREGYSAYRMLEILQQRAAYLMSRGATLNNPHIPKGFLKQFENQLITHEHAGRIREKFRTYFHSLK